VEPCLISQFKVFTIMQSARVGIPSNPHTAFG